MRPTPTTRRRGFRILGGVLAAAVATGFAAYIASRLSKVRLDPPRILPEPARICAIRLDPSYHHDPGGTAYETARDLAGRLAGAGANAVFFRVYDPEHGAFYRTAYEGNRETEFGRQDLLGSFIRAARRRGLRVYAWLPCFTHAGVWEARPAWRVLRKDGSPYRFGTLAYPLCPANHDVRAWWLGLVSDILDRYPDLAGIDIAEPVVAWTPADGCFCASCREAIEKSGARAEGLTRTIRETIALAHARGKEAIVTTIASAAPDGSLWTFDTIARETGLDLEAILSGDEGLRPDAISAELMWQEWAASFPRGALSSRVQTYAGPFHPAYRSPEIFTPRWVEGAAAVFRERLAGRAAFIAHVELSDSGDRAVSPDELRESIEAALAGGASGIDVYDVSLLDRKGAWGALSARGADPKTRRILVLHDPGGEVDAIHTATLLRHFHVDPEVRPASDYAAGDARRFDALFYLGHLPAPALPEALLAEAAASTRPVVWCNRSVEALLAHRPESGFASRGFRDDREAHAIRYKGADLPREETSLVEIEVTDPARCRARAFAVAPSGEIPYAVQCGNLWYFADLPTAYAIEGGGYLAFADLLHEIVGEDHAAQRLALVRIEDVHPLTPPDAVRRFARALDRRGIPALLALVPFYVNPEEHAFVRISDRPAFAAAIRDCAARGATIVLHGSTHQRTGESTSDYEFWDGTAHKPLARASEADVRERIERALAECHANGIHPLLWETPHYAATDADYAVFADYFSAAVERRQARDEHGSDQLLPYVIPRDRFGQLLLPEALGYVPLDDQRAEPILAAARRALVVRDGCAGFFFHTFCDLGVLEEIVDGMTEMGYRFVDPRVLPLAVRPVEGRATADPGAAGEFVIPSGSFPCRPLCGIALQAPGGVDASGLLAEIGAGIRAVPVETFAGVSHANLIIVPPDAAEALSVAERESLLAAARAGAGLIAWGDEALASALGIERAGEVTRSRLQDPDYSDIEFRIGAARSFSPLRVPEDSTIVCETPEGEPVAAVVDVGEGKALFSALPLAGAGAVALPFLADGVAREFRLLPLARAKRIEIYFDPGEREDVAVEDLVKEWARMGVRTIHAAGWHAYPEWVYEYDRLVDLAHQNAMLVHLWLALPHVSERFRQGHPEWRERTATGEEATIDWRPAMALLDEGCESAAREEVREIFRMAAFDGVTLAELSFGSRAGLDDPAAFTPFHASAIERFRNEIGFDPRDVLDEASPRFHRNDPAAARTLLDARARAVTELHRRWLAFLAEERDEAARAFEIVVALHDGLADASVRDGLGADVRAILDLRRETPFSLQVLDPGARRGSEETRFAAIEREYAPLLDGGEWIAHVNITQERSEADFPEGPDVLAGQVLLETIARLGPRRVAIYSEDALFDVDKPFLAFAAASGTEVRWADGGFEIEAPATVRVPIAPRLRERMLLDGAAWRGGSPGEAIIPAGKHAISFGTPGEGLFGWILSGAQLVDASAEMIAVEPFARGIRIRYRSEKPVAAVIDEAPVKIVVSGERIALRTSEGLRGHGVFLPAGEHTAVVYTEGLLGFAVRLASVVLSRGIIAMSAIALAVVGILFVHGRVRRPRGRRSPIPGGVR